MAWAKKIYILMNKVNEMFFFLIWSFLKEIVNMFSVFLSFCSNTRESLGELKKAVETLSCRLMFSQHFSFSVRVVLVLFFTPRMWRCNIYQWWYTLKTMTDLSHSSSSSSFQIHLEVQTGSFSLILTIHNPFWFQLSLFNLKVMLNRVKTDFS